MSWIWKRFYACLWQLSLSVIRSVMSFLNAKMILFDLTHNKDISQQYHICIKKYITERKTLNDGCHKHALKTFIFMTCHVMIMKVSCWPYAHPFDLSVTKNSKELLKKFSWSILRNILARVMEFHQEISCRCHMTWFQVSLSLWSVAHRSCIDKIREVAKTKVSKPKINSL